MQIEGDARTRHDLSLERVAMNIHKSGQDHQAGGVDCPRAMWGFGDDATGNLDGHVGEALRREHGSRSDGQHAVSPCSNTAMRPARHFRDSLSHSRT